MESHRETGKREKGTAALPLLPVVTALLGNMLRQRGELAAIATVEEFHRWKQRSPATGLRCSVRRCCHLDGVPPWSPLAERERGRKGGSRAPLLLRWRRRNAKQFPSLSPFTLTRKRQQVPQRQCRTSTSISFSSYALSRLLRAAATNGNGGLRQAERRLPSSRMAPEGQAPAAPVLPFPFKSNAALVGSRKSGRQLLRFPSVEIRAAMAEVTGVRDQWRSSTMASSLLSDEAAATFSPFPASFNTNGATPRLWTFVSSSSPFHRRQHVGGTSCDNARSSHSPSAGYNRGNGNKQLRQGRHSSGGPWRWVLFRKDASRTC
nr:hypothetical protein Iba_chr13eCG8910 [Ipomoea batatas]